MKSHGREWQQGFRTENHNSTDTGVGEIRETKPCVNIGERGVGGFRGTPSIQIQNRTTAILSALEIIQHILQVIIQMLFNNTCCKNAL